MINNFHLIDSVQFHQTGLEHVLIDQTIISSSDDASIAQSGLTFLFLFYHRPELNLHFVVNENS
jgi:hypothetical protein